MAGKTMRAVLVLGGGVVLCLSAVAQRVDRPVEMKELPEAVRATVAQQSEGAKLRRLFSQTENGQSLYLAQLKANGRTRDLLIDQSGQVVEIDEEVSLASVPSEARATIKQKAGKGKITSVESITRNNSIIAYEAHVNTRGALSEIRVGADGKLISAASASVVIR